jgi:uncharacterized protein YndB with AHSA1/START domain
VGAAGHPSASKERLYAKEMDCRVKATAMTHVNVGAGWLTGRSEWHKVAIRCVVESACSGDTAMPNTVRLHRVLATKPDKIYRAFIEADAMAKWLPPNGFACTVHHLDAKVGGTFRMSFRNFTTGKSHSFGGEYLELVPGERLRYTDKFEDPNLPGEIQVTVTLRKVSVGTEVNIVQEGIPDAIPVEACYLGWQESLRNLARLVEPEINQ